MMQEFPVAWSHVTDLESETNSGDFAPHHGERPQSLVPHVDSETAHRLKLQILRAANQDARLAEVHQVPDKMTGRSQKAHRNLAC